MACEAKPFTWRNILVDLAVGVLFAIRVGDKVNELTSVGLKWVR
jgi:hypothetical protein